MASIIKGYNYDIFISYRQKDNKGDKWVSRFVDALKTEIEATFKEDISVYFDINPHDGLLETHDVDESLKEKLKCLIFIPIISRTYCDPKAFAWEHEFKAFVEQSSKDEFGLKVKLPNGNVANRVLPIIIYDLDKKDIKAFESVLGGVIRGVEFIYKTAGVNRPLRSKENNPQENLNHTDYRDQINKVGNTIKDILNSLIESEPSVEDTVKESTTHDENISNKKPIKKKPKEIPSVSFLYKLRSITKINPKAWRIIAFVLVIVSVGSIWYGIKNKPSTDSKPVLRYSVPIENVLNYTGRKSLAVSHNGEYLVYASLEGLYLKLLNSDEPSELIPNTSDALYPVFSPDDKWIAYEKVSGNELNKVPLLGGSPNYITKLGGIIQGMNWYDNEIICAVANTIYRISEFGGTPKVIYPLTKTEDDPNIWNPQLLPDKKTLLFSQKQEDGSWSIMKWEMGSKESPIILIEEGQDGRYLNSGHLAYTLNNNLYIRKFNSRDNQVISEPKILATKFIYDGTFNTASQIDFSDNGILAYYEQQEANRHLAWIDYSGVITTISRNRMLYYFPAISSDAQNITANVLSEGGKFPIYIINTKSGTGSLFVEDARYPIWSKDNSSIIYATGNQIFQKPLDLSTPPVLLHKEDSISSFRLHKLSSDGRYLTLTWTITGNSDMGFFDMSNDKLEMLEYYNTQYNESYPTISPNGKWLAYLSNYDGQPAIYVAQFPGPGQQIKVSLDRESGSVDCLLWAPDMTALYYSSDDPFEIWKINVQASEEFLYEEPQSIFDGGSNFWSNFGLDIHPDGARFIAVQNVSTDIQEGIGRQINVIVNWEQELEGD